MKIKKSNLEWYALRYDFNEDKVVKVNVLAGIAELIQKNIRKHKIYDKKTLKEFIRSEFMYRYWSKCEYEMLISGLSADNLNNAVKIDIWTQLEINLDNIIEYINLKCDLKF